MALYKPCATIMSSCLIIIMFFTFIEFESQQKLQKYIIPQKSIRILKVIGEGSHHIHTHVHV